MSKAGEVLALLEDTKKSRMYDNIRKHGENLNAIFKTNLEPVTLSKKLLSLENKMHKANLDHVNQGTDPDATERSVLAALDKLLGYKAKKIPIENNGDPRGYALKIDSNWVSKNRANIYTDFAGYGILAPNFKD